MKVKVDEELELLQRLGIIEPVKFSRWAAPPYPVLKEDQTAQICVDYKVTVNRVSKLEEYPLPCIDDLCNFGRGSAIHKAGHEPGLPATAIRQGLKRVHHDQHTQGVV